MSDACGAGGEAAASAAAGDRSGGGRHVSAGSGPDPGSFRDPGNRVVHHDGEVYRALDDRSADEVAAMRALEFFPREMARGRILDAADVERPDGLDLAGPWTTFVRHPRLDVWTYPDEWSFSMLQDAALLQLELLAAALAEDAVCKDATPYNVQFVGTTPVFVDVGSFERLTPGDPWFGYLQFCQLFLYPLLVQAYAEVAFQPLLRAELDGIGPDLAARLLGARRAWRRGVAVHVLLHARAQARFADADGDVKDDLARSGFSRRLIEANVAGLTTLVRGLRWDRSESEWSGYAERTHYASADLEAKEAFVAEAAGRRRWDLAWDVGCNDGRFARVVAPRCGHVLAFDADHLVVDLLYRRLRGAGPGNITPLVVDLADPSPARGWRSVERAAFLDRNRPDLVLFLAVIHHLAISGNVPLPEVVAFLRSLDAVVVLEFPTEDDPMVRRLLRTKRAGVHDGYRLEHLDALVDERFDVRRRQVLAGGERVLFELAPR